MNTINKLIDHIQKQDRFLESKGINTFRLLCPECQTGFKNGKGKSYTRSDAKGYIYKQSKGSYELWSFHCKLNTCLLNKAIRIDKFIQAYYPELYSFIPEAELELLAKNLNPSSRLSNPTIKDSIEPAEPKITKLPRSSPQKQAGLGGYIDHKIKTNKPLCGLEKKYHKYYKKIPPAL